MMVRQGVRIGHLSGRKVSAVALMPASPWCGRMHGCGLPLNALEFDSDSLLFTDLQQVGASPINLFPINPVRHGIRYIHAAIVGDSSCPFRGPDVHVATTDEGIRLPVVDYPAYSAY